MLEKQKYPILSDDEMEKMSEEELRQYLVKMIDEDLEKLEWMQEEVLANWNSYSEDCRTLILAKLDQFKKACMELEENMQKFMEKENDS